VISALSTPEYARAALLLLHEPLRVTVVGKGEDGDTARLLEEAHKLAAAYVVLDVLEPDVDGALLTRAGLDGARSGARAYVCHGSACAAPVETPEDLRRIAAEMARA
jgi:uncharacterized protein YyaL (SSP411 family)